MKLSVSIRVKPSYSLFARIRSWFKRSKITEMEKRLIDLDIPFIATSDYIRIIEIYYDGEESKHVVTHYYNIRTDLWVFQVDQDNGIFGTGFNNFLTTYVNYQDKKEGDKYDESAE